MKRPLFVCAIVLALSFQAAAKERDKDKADPATFPMLTISDPGRPFTVLDGTCINAPYPPITLTDGFSQTLNQASKSTIEQWRRKGADAMVGMQVSWESPTNTGQKGRIVLCGTYIKYR